MTEEQLREKWGHLTDEQVEAAVGAAIDLVVAVVARIDLLDAIEHGERAGITREEAEFMHDMMTDPRFGDIIREGLE